MKEQKIVSAGKKIEEAGKVLILLHGRGAYAEDILSLAENFSLDQFAVLAPQAHGHTWYPYSFLVPVAQNEPFLSDAIQVIDRIVQDVLRKGIPENKIYFAGFSQGACLTLEYATRKAKRWGGVIAFTGGLIGAHIDTSHYQGNFEGTPVFIGTSDPDPHVPVVRVNESAEVLKAMGAKVLVKVYRNMGHTINQEEVELADKILTSS